ncbi:protein ImuA [Novosphingobium sp. PhB165]|uniref:ImuA family protein n=1 Tax=Novosphingobium sp. PhB165 TaxID=2485105 RepID=UPI001049B64E|nr:hypothetical protein [Novosphingobium sp. PhB165]TCM22184.1 protein ImuA [Novosphingobium sp. PhB165]
MADKVFKLTGSAAERLAQAAGSELPALECGRLHEIHASADDRAAAFAFALCGSDLRGEPGKPGAAVFVQMARAPGRAIPAGDGLALLGVPPARLLFVETENELDLLRAGLEAARCPGVELVLLDTRGSFAKYDLTASRRLALAAEQSRCRVIVLRQDAEPRPSAAQTRWAISSAPSHALEANAPGSPAMEATLLRWRNGPAGRRWRLEWDGDHGTFRDATDDTTHRAPLPGTVVPLFGMRESAEGGGPEHTRAA